MCYYIGIDDLAANALIELLKKDDNRRFVSYDSLKGYGANVLKTLQDDGEEAILIYTRDSKAAFLRDYSDFFIEVEKDGKGSRPAALCCRSGAFLDFPVSNREPSPV